MSVRVEFFGLVRKRAGVAFLDVEADDLGTAILMIGKQLPQLAESCFDGNRLQSGFIANLNGNEFTNDLTRTVNSGDSILILSADAGG